jgi:chromosomal replication initiation ATPase DnaA
MSMMVPWRKTMGSAKLLVGKKPPTPRRDRLIAMARKWNREHAQASAPKPKPIIIHDKVNIPILPHTSPSDIIQRVAFWHDVTAQEILSDSRLIPIVEARFDAIAAVRINCRIAGRRPGLMDLARQFKRDHTSIISALRQRGLRG